MRAFLFNEVKEGIEMNTKKLLFAILILLGFGLLSIPAYSGDTAPAEMNITSPTLNPNLEASCTVLNNQDGSVTIDCGGGIIATVATAGGGVGTSCSVKEFSDGSHLISCF